MKIVTFSLAVSRLMLFVFFYSQSSAATLEWKFTPGEVQNYHLTQSAILTEGDGEAFESIASVKQELDIVWTVKEVSDDGTAIIAIMIPTFTIVATGPNGQEVRYDSTSEEEPQGYAAMLMPLGKELSSIEVEFKMSPRGEVSELKIPQGLLDVVKSVPSGKKYAQDGGLKSFEAIARLGAPVLLPEGEVENKQTWNESQEIDLPLLGQLTAKFDYTVKESADKETILVDQKLTIDPAAEDSQKLEIVNQESSGTLEFNTAEGLPESSTLNFTLEQSKPGEPGRRLKVEQSNEYRRVVEDSQL